nr:PREDICTED: receptor-type tyrosine-protein phosphatase delta [Anolis carolinensis]|eukprot:XP_016853293.1 PREDICTED: receptor-type tyrosine-protein phosphatase delta [Anolis carolinensis]
MGPVLVLAPSALLALVLMLLVPGSAGGESAEPPNQQEPLPEPPKCKVTGSLLKFAGFSPDKKEFYVNETASVSCQKIKEREVYEAVCVAEGEGAAWDLSRVPCLRCQELKAWDGRLDWTPRALTFAPGETLSLTCAEGFRPVPESVRCVEKTNRFGWNVTPVCQAEEGSSVPPPWTSPEPGPPLTTPGGSCSRAEWPPSISADEPYNKETFAIGEWVWVSCRSEQYVGRRSRIACIKKDGHPEWDTSGLQCVEKPRVSKEDLQASASSIRLRWGCSPPGPCPGWTFQGSCQLNRSPHESCKRHRWRRLSTSTQNQTLHCDGLAPSSSYHVIVYGVHAKVDRQVLYEEDILTQDGVPDAPERGSLDLSSRVLRWRPPSPCKGAILGYQVNVTGRRAYNTTFLEEEQVRVNDSVTEFQKEPWRPGTNYTVTVQALTAAGAGQELRWEMETGIAEPFIPPGARALEVHNISASDGTVFLRLEPLPDLHGPIREYQLFVAPHPEPAPNASACPSLQLRPFDPTDDKTYAAAVIPASNLTRPMGFVVGDGRDRHGLFNAPLHEGRNYTVLLRVVSRWNQEETSSCVAYDFSMGRAHLAGEGEGEGGGVLWPLPLLLTCLLLTLALALLLLLGLLMARKKKKKKQQKTKVEVPRGHGAVPLQRQRGGASKLHTRIPVPELPEVLKRHKRAEMEAAVNRDGGGDDGSAESPAAGRDVEFQKLVSGLLHPCLAGKEPQNLPKNRYKSILPYDGSRVVLQTNDGKADYINASYIDGYRAPKRFIAAQGPLPGTVQDFWRMVWQERTPVIVMLTGLVEQNKRKCEQYWPPDVQAEYGDITVTLSDTWAAPGIVSRTFSLKKAGAVTPRKVEHFQCLQWPDHGLPRDPAGLLWLLEEVDRQVSEAPSAGPIVVHCSAGVGRTGTFIALDSLLKMGRSEGHVDIFRCVQKMREQRASMVQTKGQYAFLYEALLEGLLCGNTGVPVEEAHAHASRLEAPSEWGPGSGFAQEFQALERLSELFSLAPRTEAQKPCNQTKNRSPEILPADGSRPLLMSSLKADGTPGYINATFVDGYGQGERFLATQLPLPETQADFWALAWDYRCRTLVLLDSPSELDQTCPAFWPASSTSTHGVITVALSSEEPRTGYTVRGLSLSSAQQVRLFYLYI